MNVWYLNRASSSRIAHFLPDFLMPWLPVFIGPLPPAFLAISSRAFLSVQKDISKPLTRMPAVSYIHTGCLLQLEGLVLLIFLALCGLFGLFVVDRVGTG